MKAKKNGWKRTSNNHSPGGGIKMKDYDEYQKIMRYKYGYYSFILLLALLLLNEFIMTSPDPQWGETNGLETLFIMGIVLFVFNIATIYHNAYFSKRENVA